MIKPSSSLSNRSIRLAAVLATCAGVLMSAQVAVAGEKEEYVTATRQGALKLMGFYMGPLGGMARGLVPIDVDTVARNAGRIGVLAPMLTETFALDTSEAGVTSDAKPEIWAQPEAFQGKIETLIEQAAELGRIAAAPVGEAGVDEGAIKGGIAKLGQACGSCHDDFRIKRD